ncbi:MAG: response regulator transcription factor [Chloroflexaceae bacterium]|nr:response regulator transcription factor [Chloroflexaceae bacterium]
MNILIVSRDIITNKMTRYLLEEVGYKVQECVNAKDALDYLNESRTDLVLLDHQGSEFDGFELCRMIRARYHLPLMFVAEAGTVQDRITGLKIGADDYLPKPFNPGELLARIEAVMRRYSDEFSTAHLSYQPLSVGQIHLDPVSRQVLIRDRERENLTEREFQLLYYLMQNARCILSTRQLLQKIWGFEYDVDSNLVPVYIGRLRRKIESDPLKPSHIIRVRDLGYSFRP